MSGTLATPRAASRWPSGSRATASRSPSCSACSFFGILATNVWRVSSILLPNPFDVWRQLIDVIRTGEFIRDLRVTLGEFAAAFVIATVLGVAIGYVISRSTLSDQSVRAVVRRHLCHSDHLVPAALCDGLGPRAAVEDCTRRHDQLLSHRAQYRRRLRQCRPHC